MEPPWSLENAGSVISFILLTILYVSAPGQCLHPSEPSALWALNAGLWALNAERRFGLGGLRVAYTIRRGPCGRMACEITFTSHQSLVYQSPGTLVPVQD